MEEKVQWEEIKVVAKILEGNLKHKYITLGFIFCVVGKYFNKAGEQNQEIKKYKINEIVKLNGAVYLVFYTTIITALKYKFDEEKTNKTLKNNIYIYTDLCGVQIFLVE